MGWTPYHYIAYGGHYKLAHILNQRNANVNKISDDGWTPLQLACYSGSLDTVLNILKHPKIQVNKKTVRGTALHYAVSKGYTSM